MSSSKRRALPDVRDQLTVLVVGFVFVLTVSVATSSGSPLVTSTTTPVTMASADVDSSGVTVDRQELTSNDGGVSGGVVTVNNTGETNVQVRVTIELRTFDDTVVDSANTTAIIGPTTEDVTVSFARTWAVDEFTRSRVVVERTL